MKKLPRIQQYAPLDYETDYQEALAVGEDGDDEKIRLERLLLKDDEQEVIRMSYWREGKMINRPAYSNSGIDWVCLFASAVDSGVFTFDELVGMMDVIAAKIDHEVGRTTKERKEDLSEKLGLNTSTINDSAFGFEELTGLMKLIAEKINKDAADIEEARIEAALADWNEKNQK